MSAFRTLGFHEAEGVHRMDTTLGFGANMHSAGSMSLPPVRQSAHRTRTAGRAAAGSGPQPNRIAKMAPTAAPAAAPAEPPAEAAAAPAAVGSQITEAAWCRATVGRASVPLFPCSVYATPPAAVTDTPLTLPAGDDAILFYPMVQSDDGSVYMRHRNVDPVDGTMQQSWALVQNDERLVGNFRLP